VTDYPRASSTPDLRPASRPHVRRLALVLSGGGARGAYQVGVLKALAELLPADAPIPFSIISGTSAGAIIAALVATHAPHFRSGVDSIERFWRNFQVEEVFRADTSSMLRSGLHLLLALVSGGYLARPPRSLFDNSPLRDTLERHVNFARIEQALNAGYLDALAINASAYQSALSVAFYECRRGTAPWQHAWRRGQPAELGLDHLMASAAVPFLFPAVYMEGEYFGDGAMRQVSPLSPAIQLGADRLLIIGVRPPGGADLMPSSHRAAAPSFGQMLGFMLDTLFMDGMQSDLERLQQENRLLAATGSGSAEDARYIEALAITPREDFGCIAERHISDAPRSLRVLLRTMGASNVGGRTLLSYLLFEGSYTRELMALGYADAMLRRDELQALVRSES